MTLATSHAGLVLVLHDVDLGALGLVVNDFTLGGHRGEILGAQRHLGTIHNQRDREFDGLAFLRLKTVDENHVTDLDLFLMATGFTIAYMLRSLLWCYKSYLPDARKPLVRHQQSNLH